MKDKHLDAKGKGEVNYDYKNDTLLFKIKDREYVKSIDFDDLVVDIDKEGYITGVQIFEASEMFKIDKEALRNIKYFEFDTKAENNVISIRLRFTHVRRNKQVIERGENLRRESASPLIDSEVLCTVPA